MKSTSKINLNTRGQFVVLITIASILVAIGAYFIYSYQANKTLQAKEKTLTAIATLKSKQLSRWFLDELNDSQLVANDSYLAEEVKKTLRSNALADKSRLTKYLGQIKIEHDYKDVIIASADGKSEIWGGEQPGVMNDVELRTIEKAFIQKKTLSTGLFKHESNGEEKIFIAFISVIKDADNNVLAALIGRFDASLSVYPMIEEWPIPSQTSESYLFRVEADSIVYLNNLQHINNTALNLRIPRINTELITSQAVSGKLGLVAGKDYRNEDITGFISKIEGTPWYLISKIDDSEMYQGKYVIAGVVAGLALLLIFIIIFFIGFIYKRRQKNIFKELYIKESEVWQQQEKFKVTMDSLGEGVIVTDMDAKVQYMNNHAEALTGWKFSDARGQNLGKVYPVKSEETGEKVNNILEKVKKHGIVKELANHTLLVSKNGKEIPVMDTGAPIFDAKGSLTGIVISFQDETEKRAQNHLIKESEKNLSEFFENDISGDYFATADGEILKCNPAFAQILGYNSPDELIGRNIIEFYWGPDKREEFLKITQEFKIIKNFKVKLRHKDGSELFCVLNIVGSFDESGSLVKYFGYLQDLTQQRVAEDKLHIREQLLSSVMDTQQDLICRFLPDTTLTFVNKAYCKIFGETEHELLGRKFLELVPESEWEGILSNLKRLNADNPQITYESSAFKADGSVMTMEWTDVAIFNENGEVVEFQSVGRDITEKLKTLDELIIAKEKAEESDKLKTAFINNISHEIRTPLNGILGFGQFLAEPGLSDKERIEIFNHVEQSGNRLMNTVADYMDMAMIVSGTIEMHKKEFALKPFFEEIIESTKKISAEKQIDLNTEIPIESDGLTIYSDPEFIQKILEKLLDNAIKFTKEGRITCGYSIKKGHIEFFVKDTGCGIGNDKQKLIFEMFSQEESSNTRGHEGSGLGLTIAKGLVTLLGGEINVVSEKGKGSEFTFTIPFNNPEKSISADETRTTKTKSNEKPLILIAEDDDLNFIYLETLLDSKGYNNIHAVNGAEAVDFCRQNPNISIVLMDIKMPMMNGLEATKFIRELRPELPIIAVTAYAQTGDEHRFLEAGCNDYIAKPINKEKLLSLIRQYVE